MLTMSAFFVLLFLGLPIVFLLLGTAILFVFEAEADMMLNSFLVQSVKGVEVNGFLAIPLFMLVGEIMTRGQITERLMRTAARLVGGLRGGLAYVNVVVNALAAAILGSATAQIAVMSRVIVPEMERHGYDRRYAAGLTVATGLLGPIIPPSMLMIIYGVLAYQSVATLFIAGIVPGLLITLFFFVAVAMSGKHLPARSEAPLPASSWREIGLDALPLLIPVTIIAGIVSGVMTPTESGAVATVVSVALAVTVYRSLGFGDVVPLLREVVLSSASIIALIGFATLLGWVLSYKGIPAMMADGLASLSVGPVSFLLLVCLVVFILGMFLDGIGVLIFIVPILLPVAQSFGVDPIHFGVVLAVATLTGLVSPPVGPGLYIAMDATGLKMLPLFKATLPFMFGFLLALLAIVLLPELSVALPAWLAL
ncbi:TRAP transporter, DctM subunit [Thauera chlorobenzoica]|uniref:TRAP transporter large permease protein n=2 Tax=Thauera chlorobenzoica TaxID=96773 RepID=A0A1H5XWF6_9RHOO|nr:TRAP-type C4-dicarboxylate transporter permease DbtM [Thauera chlorobenzoica]SEG15982.1 TRAP transporter, DctM subunit [Thauera chlorobenzoica]